MCGFVVTFNGAASDVEIDFCDDVAHRGPDSVGHHTVSGPGWQARLHFRRLAIVDLNERSDQPFGDHRRGVLVYNGEIYNQGDIRGDLAKRGVVFSTMGDTEVIYELLLQPDWVRLLDRVDGMFAFVLILPTGELRFGRDRFGIKPLYITRNCGGAVTGLASEIVPLRRAGLTGEVDPIAVAQGIFFLWTPPPRTGWLQCETVRAGTVWSAAPPDYRRTTIHWQAGPLPTGDDIGTAVRRSLERQVRADVKVGLLLSGGLDSTWLAVELARTGFDGPILVARTAAQVDRSSEPFDDDAPFAARVAEELGLGVTWLDLDVDVLRQIPRLADVVEHPFGDPAALVLLGLCEKARGEAKVLLSGVGVEELFLGYERYQAVRTLQRMPEPARRLLARSRSLPSSRRFRERSDKLLRLLALEPRDWSWASQSYYSADEWTRLVPGIALDDVVAEHRSAAAEVLDDGGSPLEALAHCDRQLFLPGLNLCYGDRASMRASVELRVPFLSEDVAATALAVPAEEQLRLGNGKARFRAAAEASGVPDFVARRPKTGFGAPVRGLLRKHGSEIWERVQAAGLFRDLVDPRVAGHFMQEHVHSERERGLALYGLLSAAAWWEKHVSDDSTIGEALGNFSPDKSSTRQ